MKNIAIMFGGQSPEHEVSVITGLQIVENIDTEKYNPIPVYVAKDGKWYTGEAISNVENYRNLNQISEKAQHCYIIPEPNHSELTVEKEGLLKTKNEKINIDAIFPCFHGGLGENGGFQSLYEIAGIPYVGSDRLSGAVGFDKVHMKKLFAANDIPQAPYDWIFRNDWKEKKEEILKSIEDQFEYPMFVKPANGGSSIGTTKAKNKEELENAIDVAASFDRKIIIEQGIENAKEINISVIGNSGSKLEVSVCEQVFGSEDGTLSYEDKYVGEEGSKGAKGAGSKGMASTKRQIPADISDESRKKIEDIARKAFEALDNFGLVRNDFLIKEETDEIYIIETNTIPGSMSFYLWEATELPIKEMISKLIGLAFERAVESKDNVMTFQSNILENFKLGGTKGVKG